MNTKRVIIERLEVTCTYEEIYPKKKLDKFAKKGYDCVYSGLIKSGKMKHIFEKELK